MEYKYYKDYTKTYVVVYSTGTGVMEDPFIEHNVVFETDNKVEAVNKAEELTKYHNSLADIESSWYRNRYHININIHSNGGKVLFENFKKEFDIKYNSIKNL